MYKHISARFWPMCVHTCMCASAHACACAHTHIHITGTAWGYPHPQREPLASSHISVGCGGVYLPSRLKTFFFFWLHLQHMKFLGQGSNPSFSCNPRQILNLLCHRGPSKPTRLYGITRTTQFLLNHLEQGRCWMEVQPPSLLCPQLRGVDEAGGVTHRDQPSGNRGDMALLRCHSPPAQSGGPWPWHM